MSPQASLYTAPPGPPFRPPVSRVPPTPPSAVNRPAAVEALVMVRDIADRYRDWREPDPAGDHTDTLVAWLRIVDDLRQLYAILGRLDAGGGA